MDNHLLSSSKLFREHYSLLNLQFKKADNISRKSDYNLMVYQCFMSDNNWRRIIWSRLRPNWQSLKSGAQIEFVINEWEAWTVLCFMNWCDTTWTKTRPTYTRSHNRSENWMTFLCAIYAAEKSDQPIFVPFALNYAVKFA